MINLCTLFDLNYFSRGLAMYQSLVETGDQFHLYILCLDDNAYSVLERMNLQFVTLIALRDFETPELLRVKRERDRAEYCWTCTPHVIAYVLETFHLSSVTYVDADLCFYAKPSILMDEFGRSGCSVLLTGHNFSPVYAHLVKAGIYCVQFMCFKADERGLTALRWWQARCTEWCFRHFEDGKLGDQKYLDDWLTRFKGIHVLQHPGGGIAPWNVQKYEAAGSSDRPEMIPRRGGPVFPVVFYHFHCVTIYFDGSVYTGTYILDNAVKRKLYMPYLSRLKKAGALVYALDDSIDPHGKAFLPKGVGNIVARLYRKIRGNYLNWNAAGDF